MSVAVEQLPRDQPLNNATVNGTQIPDDLSTSANDEKESKNSEESPSCETTEGPRVQSKKSYSKKELVTVKDCPSTKIRPFSLSEKYCNRDGIWDPELWYYSEESEKRSASPIDTKKKSLLDGFVLSPQGRSFARGCQVAGGKQEREGRNKTSGRVARGWDTRERSGSLRGRGSPSEKNGKNDRYTGPGKNRRRADSYESQPEWYTAPITCKDTMDLSETIAFEKPSDHKRKKRRKEQSGAGAAQKAENATETVDGKKFDINQFFDLAENALPISGMYENQVTSRFTQWFQDGRRSRSGSLNASGSNSRRSSFTDELAEIAGLTLGSPISRTPTPPDPEFMFTPIMPAAAAAAVAAANEAFHKDPILDLLQDNDIDVQPLLDSVIPHKTVKGAVNLQDLEGGQAQDREISSVDTEQVTPSNKKDLKEGNNMAFNKLVETMKASGNLPAKPTPTIPDIPPHLLPRPPSSRDRSRNASPIPSRSPSPLQLLQDVIRQTQSPVNFVHDPRLVQPAAMVGGRNSPLMGDMFSPVAPAVRRPRTPEDMYGAPPVFNINRPTPFEFTGSVANIGARTGGKPRYVPRNDARSEQQLPATNNAQHKPHSTAYPVISQAFVPTSVLRKLHSDKHEQKPTEVKKDEEPPTVASAGLPGNNNMSRDYPVTPQRHPLFDAPATIAPARSSSTDSSQSAPGSGRAGLMSPHEFLSPKVSQESIHPELLTPHRLPLPGSPTNMTPHRVPLPQSPSFQDDADMSSSAPTMPGGSQQLLTPRSLPLPQSPLVNAAGASTSNASENLGIRPLPRATVDVPRTRARNPGAMSADALRKPGIDMRHTPSGNATTFRRFPPGGQSPFPVGMGMVRRPMQPGLVPSPYNVNAAGRPVNAVHPTALALALRNQQYQMARAAAVAAATAAVNRPVISPAQAAAATALLLNQQRAANASAAALQGLLPQVNPRMFQQPALRPNLPPALQHQHHVVHRSEPSKDNSLSKWFSDAVLNQSQSQPSQPGRGAKVLSVEELERHA